MVVGVWEEPTREDGVPFASLYPPDDPAGSLARLPMDPVLKI